VTLGLLVFTVLGAPPGAFVAVGESFLHPDELVKFGEVVFVEREEFDHAERLSRT
jgi:hypothetical protein